MINDFSKTNQKTRKVENPETSMNFPSNNKPSPETAMLHSTIPKAR
jgi:hypothetical protein